MGIRAGSICLVTPELRGLEDDAELGSSTWELAQLLAEEGWRVHVLYCGSIQAPDELTAVGRRLGRGGIAFTPLSQVQLPAVFHTPHWFTDWDRRGQFASHAVEKLHRECRFDLVQFPEWQALGFRALQSKRAGLSFEDVGIVVQARGPSKWRREAGCEWMAHANDLLLDYCEQHAFEHADFQVFTSRYILDRVQELGWAVGRNFEVVPNPLPPMEPSLLGREASWPPEIVFWGPPSSANGLRIFLKAVQDLHPRIPITFLGGDCDLGGGHLASTWIGERLAGRRVGVLSLKSHEEKLAYLKAGYRIAVMPGLRPTCRNAVAECAALGIPFLASNVGEIPETLADQDLHAHLLFEPNVGDMRRALERYLAAYHEQRNAWSQRAHDAIDLARRERRIVDYYFDLLSKVREKARSAPGWRVHGADEPLITVAVPHHNLGEFLPETLSSVATQTYSNLEVLVVDDGSTDPASIAAFEEQSSLYPQFRFIRQPNAGVCATRNRMLQEARGEYFFPLDADNVIMPQMLERLATGLTRNPEYSAMSCFRLDFRNSEDLVQGKYIESYRPLGGPYLLASLVNVYGETSGLFRTEALRAIGGYEDLHPDYVSEDWHIYVKMAANGHFMGVVPEHLYYYRLRGDSRYHNGNMYITHQQILRHYMQQSTSFTESEQATMWTLLASLHNAMGSQHQRACQLHGHLSATQSQVGALHAQLRDAQAQNAHLLAQWSYSQKQVESLVAHTEALERKMAQLRYRLADRMNTILRYIPLKRFGKAVLTKSSRLLRGPRPEDRRLAG